ncbi:MAG: hypothetical protein OXC01_09760 [Immundisolibacterales bacterium]|nr:hypothetical protein [Immundisolibacterales bacterium]
MAYERKPGPRRRREGASETSSDPIGRLDEVLVTLEQILEDRGVPQAPHQHEGRAESPAPPDDPSGQEPLPLLRDVVAPAVAGRAEGTREGRAPEPARAQSQPLHEPLRLGFEIVPDESLPPIDDLVPDPAAVVPPGERYGDAPPPSLEPEVYRHLIDRLENEIDVIVQTGTEEAMRRAAADIAARVRAHVAIILPEVIEELVRMSRRPSD